jgi:anti-sigma B factor antagonist
MPRRADNPGSSQATETSFAIGERELDERTSVFSVEGDLDLSTAPQLKWKLLDALEAGHNRLIVDLSRTSFMDSTALGVLVGVNRSLAQEGRLSLVCAKPSLLRIFELAGLDGVFAISATLDAALESAPQRAAEAG